MTYIFGLTIWSNVKKDYSGNHADDKLAGKETASNLISQSR